MKHVLQKFAVVTLAALLVLMCGCQKKLSDADAIRAGITQHLNSLNTLNLSAMDMDVNILALQDSQARAQVSFRPKGSAPGSPSMQVTYQMKKGDSGWTVAKTEGVDGAIDHPATNANPHLQPGQSQVHGNVPDFSNLLQSTSPSNGVTLPPGHPPITKGARSKPSDASGNPH